MSTNLTPQMELTLQAIARGDDTLPPNTTRRTTNALVQRGFVEFDLEHGRWIVTESGRVTLGLALSVEDTEVLRRLNDGQPLRKKDAEVVDSLVTRKLASRSGASVFITDAGRQAIGIDTAVHLKPKRQPKKVKHCGPCACGCGQTTNGGNYMAGHDARHAGVVARQVADETDWDFLLDTNEVTEMVAKLLPTGADKLAAKATKIALRAIAKRVDAKIDVDELLAQFT